MTTTLDVTNTFAKVADATFHACDSDGAAMQMELMS
jgi:hypothetical protein